MKSPITLQAKEQTRTAKAVESLRAVKSAGILARPCRRAATICKHDETEVVNQGEVICSKCEESLGYVTW